jgi:hypothetical protein
MKERLSLAVIYKAGDFAVKVLAVHNHIDKAVLEHKYSGLESLRQFDLYRQPVSQLSAKITRSGKSTEPD